MKTKGFAAVLVSAFLLLCVLAGSAASAEGKVIVSIGDSYSSGEGNEPFYGQDAEMDQKCQDPDWLAHRSEKSWPGKLILPGVDGPMKEHRGENWFFAAASGAECKQLFLLTEEEIRAGKTAEQEKKYNREGVAGTGLIPPQLDVFDVLDAKGLKADYVTITIGGNDLGFKELIGLALVRYFDAMPYETAEEKADVLWETYYTGKGIRQEIKRAYKDTAERAGSQACILVIGYPCLLTPGSENEFFTEETMAVFQMMNAKLNRELQDIVEECRGEGMNIRFISVEEAFEGHGAYADEPWINPLIFSPQDEDLKGTVSVSAYSMHPNEAGIQAYAECVQAEIDRLESEPAENGR